MTRIITAAIIALAIAGGWGLYRYWETFEARKAEEKEKKVEAPAPPVNPEQLPGLPPYLIGSLAAAVQKGPAAMRNWLRAHGNQVQDPRKAWIELDYCRMIARDDPREARRIFAAVKARTASTSPVWPRIRDMSRAFE